MQQPTVSPRFDAPADAPSLRVWAARTVRELAVQDWLVLEVGGDQVRSGKAMEWLQQLFARAVKA